ncbi:hypothetical protein CLOL250_00477 [Clostridium sp. L2-50]|nr:hypothetical protein CLOL250_00477 [Clostridium sp. L2-50]
MVECEFLIIFIYIFFHPVLIDTWWNVNNIASITSMHSFLF